MRKIYPPPFVVFIFYGLLSLAVITSAQNACDGEGNKLNLNIKRKLVGYVRNGMNPSGINVNWDSYDYINIVADNLHPKLVVQPETLNNWVAARGSHKAKILLSVRDYDFSDWGHDGGFNTGFFNDVKSLIDNSGLDGFDIEYPGTRALMCGDESWDPNPKDPKDKEAKKVDGFKNLFKLWRASLPGKTLMLTIVHEDSLDDVIPDLIGSLDFLNIETYHRGLYDNLGEDPPKSHPNAPFDAFAKAYNNMINKILKNQPENQKKIIMGVDFGNTVQVVTINAGTGKDIKTGPSGFDIGGPLTDDVNEKVPGSGSQIKNICQPQQPQPTFLLYSFPWKALSVNLVQPNFCAPINDWVRNFDKGASKTPWLYKYRQYENGIQADSYFFVSYEDISSLSDKLALIGPTGISISDISYDDDNDSLLNIIQPNKAGNAATPPDGGGSPNNPKNNSPDNTNTEPQTAPPGRANVSSIVGGVLGGLMGSVLLVTAGFLWYRRKNPKTKEVPRGSFASHTALKNEGDQNQIVQNTVIPVAPGYVTAMFDFTGKEENDLSFRKGDKIEVLEKGDGPNDWWVGRVNGVVGEFPGNYVKET